MSCRTGCGISSTSGSSPSAISGILSSGTVDILPAFLRYFSASFTTILAIHALRDPSPLYSKLPNAENIFTKLFCSTSFLSSLSARYLEQTAVRYPILWLYRSAMADLFPRIAAWTSSLSTFPISLHCPQLSCQPLPFSRTHYCLMLDA